MFKKIIFLCTIIASFYVVGGETQIALQPDFSNWSEVFEAYKDRYNINLGDYRFFATAYQYWSHVTTQIKMLANDEKVFKKVFFLKVLKEYLKEPRDICVFHEKGIINTLFNTDKTEVLEIFGNKVCQDSDCYYFLLQDGNICFFYDKWAPWYMRIKDVNTRKKYIDDKQVLKLKMNFSVYDFRAIFAYPESFLQEAIYPICNNDIVLKKQILEKVVCKFLKHNSDAIKRTTVKSLFLYGYCYFFNYVLKACESTVLAVTFPCKKRLDGLLYDNVDLFSVLLDDVEDIQTKKLDILSFIQSTNFKCEKAGFKNIIKMIVEHDPCMKALVLLYKDNLQDINYLIQSILDSEQQESLQSAILVTAQKLHLNYCLENKQISENKALQLPEKLTCIASYDASKNRVKKEENVLPEGPFEYKNMVLKKVLDTLALVNPTEEERYETYYQNDAYQWANLSKLLLRVINRFEDKTDLNNLINDIVVEITRKEFLNSAEYDVARQIYQATSLDLNFRQKIADHVCTISQKNQYVILDDNNQFIFQRSPFAIIYNSIQSIQDRKTKAKEIDKLQFTDDYGDFESILLEPKGLVEYTLMLLPDNQKLELLKIAIEQFQRKHAEQFLFGYVYFFNYVIEKLTTSFLDKTAGEHFRHAVDNLIKQSKFKFKSIFINDIEHVMLEDELDFYSIGDDKNALSLFISAIQNSDPKILNRMRLSLLQGSNRFRSTLINLLTRGKDKKILLSNVNTFLQKIYTLTSINDNEIIEQELENFSLAIATNFKGESVTIVKPEKIMGPLYYQIKVSLQSSTKPLAQKKESNQPEQKSESRVQQPISKNPIKFPEPEVPLIRENQSPSQQISEQIVPKESNEERDEENATQGGQANGGWTGWNVLSAIGNGFKALGNLIAWPFVTLWSLITGKAA